MFKAVKITTSNANNDSLRNLFESSFPEEEGVPYDEFIKPIDKFNLDYEAFYEREKLVGIFGVYILPKYNYAQFLAVPEDLRCKGIGQKLLTVMLEKYGKEKNPLIGDVESTFQEDAPNLEIRKRRQAFYLRNGFKETGRCYTYKGVSYQTLSTSNEPMTQEEHEEILESTLPIIDELNKNFAKK